MRKAALAAVALLLLGVPALARDTQFWNLTANTITSFQLAPAGTDKWGANQTANDKDGSVDHDERLKIVGVQTGVYDVKFTDDKGRTCTVKKVSVKQGGIFNIEEKSLKGCQK